MNGTHTSGRLAKLGASIADNTAVVDKYLQENKLKQPSFNEDAFDQDFASLPPDVATAREAALDATEELQDLLKDQIVKLQEKTCSSGLIFSPFIVRFDIPHKVPVHGSKSYADLAKETGINESTLRQILRAAITHRVFVERTPGQISHSATSRLLVENPGLFTWLQTATDDFVPAIASAVDAIEKWPACEEPSQTGATLFHDTKGKGYYEWLMDQPERGQRFATTMAIYQQGEGYHPKHTVNNFAWDTVRTVVDIGGSTGPVAFALAEKYPNLEITVQDLPPVVAGAQKQRPDLNVTFQGHDFFDQQPVRGADVYYFRWILHNWSDKYALRILRALVPALKPGARIVIMDEVMPAPGEVSNRSERMMRYAFTMLTLFPLSHTFPPLFSFLLLPCPIRSPALLSQNYEVADTRLRRFTATSMLAAFNAPIRSLDEWKALLHGADARFRFDKATRPLGSRLSVLEAVWDP